MMNIERINQPSVQMPTSRGKETSTPVVSNPETISYQDGHQLDTPKATALPTVNLVEEPPAKVYTGRSPSSSTFLRADTQTREAAGAVVGRGYLNQAEAGNVPLGSMQTMSERIDIMRHVSQLDHLSETAENRDRNRCGPASIVAGVMIAGGSEGLTQLIEAIRSYNSTGENLSELAAIEARLRDGNATRDDLSRIQDALYRELQGREQDSNPYIYNSSLASFIQANPAIEQLFAQNGMAIKNIDTGDADSSGNHFVLAFSNQEGNAIYDPWPRGTGQQVITGSSIVSTYMNATDSQAYPLTLPSDSGQSIQVSQIVSHDSGEYTFIGKLDEKPVLGIDDGLGQWQAVELPLLNSKIYLPELPTTAVTLLKVTPKELAKILALKANQSIAEVWGKGSLPTIGETDLKGELKGDGVITYTEFFNPVSERWEKIRNYW